MSSSASDQLDLLDAKNPANSNAGESGRLGIMVEQQDFLQFLSSEWLFPSRSTQLILGIGSVCTQGGAATDTSVAIWFDIARLPEVALQMWTGGRWSNKLLSELSSHDKAVVWEGPLPAFAVSHYVVASREVREHLLAMVRNFADMDLPLNPLEVGRVDCWVAPQAPQAPGPSASEMTPPPHWDALRGAAAMAAWAVPAIDPWLDLLCDTLTGSGVRSPAWVVDAPWGDFCLRQLFHNDDEELPPLLRAIIAELSRPGVLREWRPKAILEAVFRRAADLGDDETRLKRLLKSSLALLDDRATIEQVGLADDHLALTFQLLLLRPSPEHFVSWREDWPALPPGAWWAGMTLAGYLRGFRALPRQWRGGPSSRRLLALRTWKLGQAGHAGVWKGLAMEKLDWIVDDEVIVLRADGEPWEKHKVGIRGLWYRADFSDLDVLEEAEDLAREIQPQLLRTVLVLKDTSLRFSSEGSLKVEAKKNILTANGHVELELTGGTSVEVRLDVGRFRYWMATASVKQRIRRPSMALRPVKNAAKNISEVLTSGVSESKSLKGIPEGQGDEFVLTKQKATAGAAPVGLAVFGDFISLDEERKLIEIIDAAPWDTTMKREVQHYGWRYDYRLRKVDPSSYLGPLPNWALDLAQRLRIHGLVAELPDQVIVNNYQGAQGISKHIDCPGCFRGAIVTISLNEAWEMFFSRRLPGNEVDRYRQVLPRRSAVVMAGEARYSWAHEIPQRQKEGRILRGRRISITFRKVDVSSKFKP